GPRTVQVVLLAPGRVVAHFVGMGPDRGSGLLVEAAEMLPGLGALPFGVGHVDPALGHHGAAVAAADGYPPADLQALGGERPEEIRLPPDGVPLGSAELIPVVGVGDGVRQ